MPSALIILDGVLKYNTFEVELTDKSEFVNYILAI